MTLYIVYIVLRISIFKVLYLKQINVVKMKILSKVHF